MSQVEWQQVKDLFYTALTRPDAERASFLDSACGENKALRSEIEVLLDSYLSDFLEGPLLADAKPRSPGPPLFEEGHTFSHYEIVRLLGRGGMGEVYLADDTALGRQTAIKIIHNESGFGDQAAARLLREARAAAKLDHPNICSVYEVGETDGSPFIAMQHVEGEILDSLIADGSIGFDDAVSFARQIAAALVKAHSFGIVHRDIKPSNVMVDARKHVTVLDFGLAKETLPDARLSQLSEAGLIAGTVTYMSPEHLRGQEVDEKTDIWSLGVLFYQMVTGRLPFRGESKADLISAILNSEPDETDNVPSDQVESVNYVLERALNKDPALRYPTIEVFDADLAKLAANEGIENLPTQRWTWLGQRRAVRYALPAILLLALVAAGVGLWQSQAANDGAAAFSTRSAGNLQITSLYSLKRQLGGAITDLSFSPDSQSVAFTLDGRGPSSIYSLAVSGGVPVRLSDGKSAAQSPVWSADGRRIAYLSDREGKKAIWEVSIPGGDPTLLAEFEGNSPAYELVKWSDDGSKIFYEDPNGPKEIQLASGKVSPLDVTGIDGKILPGFSMSRDETQLLLTSAVDGNTQLWTKVIGGEAANIGEMTSTLGMPYWLPDGSGYAYSAEKNENFQVFVRRFNDPEPQQITFAGFSATTPVVSPDGRHIIYVSNADEANLYLLDVASRKEDVLTQNVNMQLFPAFSPDAKSIAYQTVTEASKLTSALLRIDSLGNDGDPSRLTLPQSGCCVQWSPNGQEVAFVRRSGANSNISTVGLKDQSAKEVTTGGISMPPHSVAPFDLAVSPFQWSPDGSKIAFVARRSGNENVWTVNRDGTAETMLSDLESGMGRAVSPRWSPDGGTIAYVEAIGSGPATAAQKNRIAVYENGAKRIAAEFEGRLSFIGWAEDGAQVYVGVPVKNGQEIYSVDVRSPREPLRIATLPDASAISIRLSPDRKRLAYTARRFDIDNLYVLQIGGKPTMITTNDDPTLFYSGVTWSPDSRNLLYSKQTGGMIISLISTTNKEDE
jgi:serine/threonine protein kinase